MQRQPDVLETGERRQQVEELEDEADLVPPHSRQIVVGETREQLAVDPHVARACGVEAADEVEQRGLAGSRRPDDRHHLAAIDRQRDVVERDDAALAVELLGDGEELDGGPRGVGRAGTAREARAVSMFHQLCESFHNPVKNRRNQRRCRGSTRDISVEYLTTVPAPPAAAETFSPDEVRALAPYFTNTDRTVFALRNLPETVKGALFARYSRSAKSLRRLFLDEFLGDVGHAAAPRRPAGRRRSRDRGSTRKVLSEFGDDSVAQLGAAHVACEGVSNILTKVLEWGRLMAYLEQSTRYVPYTARPNGRWKYHVPAELQGSPLHAAVRRHPRPRLRDLRAVDSRRSRSTSARSIRSRRTTPTACTGRSSAPRRSTRSAVCCPRRRRPTSVCSARVRRSRRCCCGCSRTRSRKSGRTRRRSSPKLREVIPAFLTRVDQPDRGGRAVEYLTTTRRDLEAVAREAVAGESADARGEVTLTDFDRDGETKVVAAALYPLSNLPDDQLLALARRLSPDQRLAILEAYGRPSHEQAAQAGTRLRADELSVRRARRLRRVPRSAAASAADARMAAAQRAPRLRRAGRHRGSRRPRRLAGRHGSIGGAVREAVGGRAARRRAVCRRHGVPRALLHGDERTRSDASDRAADVAAGTSLVPPRSAS